LNRYRYIDSMRGCAALGVVLFHLWNRFYPGVSTAGHPFQSGTLDGGADFLAFFSLGFGYSGVTLFFVLSGLCIHLPQARKRINRIDVKEFALRRFWRLYPAYLASIGLTMFTLAAPVILATGAHVRSWWYELQVNDALINAVFMQQLWPRSLEFNGVYWTLVFELQFYAVYPALLWCLRKVGLVAVGGVLLGVEVFFTFIRSPIPLFFPIKYFEWFLGLLAAELIARAKGPHAGGWAALATLGLGGGVLFVFMPLLYHFQSLSFAIGYFGLVMLVAGRQNPLARVFDLRLLAGLGVISYSLYLVHVPVIDVVWSGLHHVLMQLSLGGLDLRWLYLSAVPACVAAAVVFYWLFERPYMRSAGAKPAVAG
jgi:peptidoglycan/LPS O-acetylase OafA/YrhL